MQRLFRKIVLELSTLVFLFLVASAQADAPACSVYFLEDKALMNSLSERVRFDLESSRVKLLLSVDDSERQVLYGKLDGALKKYGPEKKIKMGSFSAKVRFQELVSGKLQLVVSGAETDSHSGIDFLKYIAAQTEWLAIQREKLALNEIEVIGEGVRGSNLENLMKSMGFKPVSERMNCYAAAAIGFGAGAVTGYVGGMIYFRIRDAHFENGSVYEQQRRHRSNTLIGAGGGATAGVTASSAVFCFGKGRGNFSLTLAPRELSP